MRNALLPLALAWMAVGAAAQECQVLALAPEAAQMPAPDWVKPGLRMTYYIGVGVNTGADLMPYHGDKDKEGAWLIEGRPGTFDEREGTTEGSGNGYFEIRVVGASRATPGPLAGSEAAGGGGTSSSDTPGATR